MIILLETSLYHNSLTFSLFTKDLFRDVGWISTLNTTSFQSPFQIWTCYRYGHKKPYILGTAHLPTNTVALMGVFREYLWEDLVMFLKYNIYLFKMKKTACSCTRVQYSGIQSQICGWSSEITLGHFNRQFNHLNINNQTSSLIH